MIFQYKKSINYGFQSKVFLNEFVYNSSSKISSIVNSDGYISPNSCAGVAEDKLLAVLKGYSESIERRSLAIGTRSSLEDECLAFELLQKSIVKVPKKYSKYSIHNPIIDTTGTAAHPDALEALYNALIELIEKNALFLFWYGKQRYVIDIDVKYIYEKLLEQMGYKVKYFLISDFKPVKVVVTLAYSEHSPIIYKFGIGTSLHLKTAIKKSVAEAFLLSEYYDSLFFDSQYKSTLDSNLSWTVDTDIIEELTNIFNSTQKAHLDILMSEASLFINNDTKQNINLVIGALPNWITEIYVFNLSQMIRSNLSVIKVFSPDLLSHIPRKEHINVDSSINKHTLKLTSEQLNKLPNCPIV